MYIEKSEQSSMDSTKLNWFHPSSFMHAALENRRSGRNEKTQVSHRGG